ncbi:MAG: hypothetical protein ACR2GL_05170 [Thermoleophilaceae bacterium]
MPGGSDRALLSAARPSLRYNGTITGLDAPFAVAFNRYSRKIYVTEPGRNRVVVFDRLGRRRGSFGASALQRPTALAFDFAGNLAVLSSGSREIALFRPGGRLIAKTAVPAAVPLGLAYEPGSRRVLVTDALLDAVLISGDGGRTWIRERPAGLTTPVGAASRRGRFYVVSSADARLMELSPAGRLIRALPLGRARRPVGITFPPFGTGMIVSAPDSHVGLFGPRPEGPLTRFGGAKMRTPVLPGSECARAAFPDLSGNRVVAFDLPTRAGCVQGVGVRKAVTARSFRRIVASVVVESDSRVAIRGRASVPSRGRVKRYRLRRARPSLRAGSLRKVRIAIPPRAARGIRRALAQRRSSTVRLTFTARNRAGDRRRVVARLVYRPRALRGLATGGRLSASASMTVAP